MLCAGPPVPQLKLTTASVRVSVARVLKDRLLNAAAVVFVQYWPSSPTPWPGAAVLTNEAYATPLLTASVLTATACTISVFVITNGPVYNNELVPGTVPSSV